VRFVLAIVAFVLAAVMIMLGIAQRTVFLEPASTSLSATVDGGERYAVITAKALAAHPGSQTITVSGSDTVFLPTAAPRTSRAWLADDPHADRLQGGSARLTSRAGEPASTSRRRLPRHRPRLLPPQRSRIPLMDAVTAGASRRVGPVAGGSSARTSS
jgi:hypothetical protein